MSFTRDKRSERGQSVVEFALIVPLLCVIVIAIADFGRVFTAMIATESAAREAADYGAFRGSGAWTAANRPSLVADMQLRACTAVAQQPGYDNSAGNCSQNPVFAFELLDWNKASNTYTPVAADSDACSLKTATQDPCVVHATVTFQFRPIVPLPTLLRLLGGGGSGGDTVTIQRDAYFSVSDLTGS